MAITLPHDAMAQLFHATPANDLPAVPEYNVCPTVQVATVTSEAGSRRLRPMRWGLVPHWAKAPGDGPLLINARAETVAEKPAFRAACRDRRCLVPATGFYEWTKAPDGARLPWFITRADGAPVVMGGIWQDWERDGERVTSFAIVTTHANAAMARIHDRMPLILAPADWPLWLGEAGKGAATLMRPAPDDALVFHRVGREVNSNRARGPELVAPVEE